MDKNKPSQGIRIRPPKNDEPPITKDSKKERNNYYDLNDSADVQSFYGRERDLEILKNWIFSGQCKVICVIGMNGIGKSTLISKLCREESENFNAERHFDFIIWRSLVNTPSVFDILNDINAVFSDNTIDRGGSLGEQINALLSYLREKRCLLIFDNVESILSYSELDSQGYKEGFEGYGDIFHKIGTISHQSSLILLSREKINKIYQLEGTNKPVRSLRLGGLDSDSCRKIFNDIDIFESTEDEWKQILNLYDGNPLTLNLVAKHISEVYNCDISNFLQNGKVLFNDIRELLEWHFNRLSGYEKEIMRWMAIYRQPVNIKDLERDLLEEKSKQLLTSTLQSLQRKIPLEKIHGCFQLQSVFMEFITNIIIQEVNDDIKNMRVSTIGRYSLLKAFASDIIREAQINFILKPINVFLENEFRSLASYEKHLHSFLFSIKNVYSRKLSYLGGNVLNLLCQLKKDVVGYDFSSLMIKQAYLQENNLYSNDFSGSIIDDCLFRQTYGPVSCIASSKDGKFFAASEFNGDIHIWRTSDFQIIKTLKGHVNWIFALTFSPDDKSLASGGEDKTIRIWDIETELCKNLLQGHNNSVWSLDFNPDGSLIASGGEDESVKVWEVSTGECIKILSGHNQKVFAVSFSKNGDLLVSASSDHSIILWDTTKWEKSKVLTEHTGAVRDVAFSSLNNCFASCGWDGSIKVWNLDGSLSKEFKDHSKGIHSVAFHPTKPILASSNESGVIRIWDLEKNVLIKILYKHTGEVWKICFTSNGEHLISGGYDCCIRIWDCEDWQCKYTLHGYIDWVQGMDISNDNKIIAASYGDLKIRLWELATGKCINTIEGHTGWTFSIKYSIDGKFFITGSDDLTIKIWDTKTWKNIMVIKGHSNWIQCIALNSDSTLLASGSDDRTIKIWNIKSGECKRTLRGHAEGVWSVVFSPDDKYIISGSEDSTVRIWDIADNNEHNHRILKGHKDRVHSIDISNDGTLIASGSDDSLVKIWELKTGKCQTTLEGHAGYVIAVCFSAKDTYIASGGKDKTVRIWEKSTGECLKILSGHKGGIWSVAFTQDESFLISASEDGSIRVWDVISGECVRELRKNKPYEASCIHNVKGLTSAQKKSLKVLGAIDYQNEETQNFTTHNYKLYAKDYAKLKIDGTYYLGFRDIPDLLNKYSVGLNGLDYGCGNGRSTTFLKRLGYNMTGVDISHHMIAEAKKIDSKINYFLISSGKLPYDDDEFDFVFSSYVFIEISSREEIERIVVEIERVLKPGGIFIFITAPAEEYQGNWVSFDYNFKENQKEVQSGDTVKLKIKDSNVILYDYIWKEEDFRMIIRNTKLKLMEIHNPLGKSNDPIKWLDENRKPYNSIYILKK